MTSAAVAPGVTLVAVGLHLTLRYARDLWFALASEDWRATDGRIVAQDAQGGSPGRGDSASDVAYACAVDGRALTSRRYDYAGRNVGRGAGAVLLAHEVGTPVIVRYDPRRPTRAVLVAGATAGNYWRLAAGTGLLLLGVVVLLTAPS